MKNRMVVAKACEEEWVTNDSRVLQYYKTKLI